MMCLGLILDDYNVTLQLVYNPSKYLAMQVTWI